MKKRRIRCLNAAIEDNYDVFICSASFEDRSISISEKLKHKSFQKVVIMENEKGSNLIRENAEKIYNLFGKKAVRLELDFIEQLSVAEKINKELNSVQGRKINVLIDITTFTHETLLICLKVLSINSKVDKVTCVYVNAAAYCPDEPIQNKWLSQGCEEVHSVLGYPGALLPSLKTHLVVVVGYEYNRAFDMIADLEPNSISLVYGSSDDAITEKDREANSKYMNLVKEMAFEFSNIESKNISCNHPDKIVSELQEIYDSHLEDNIIVVPMNNKMSTVGVALSAFNNERVQVCYAPAVVYNESNYSTPGQDCYIFAFK